MNVETLTPAHVIQITDHPGLDPITLIIQDFRPGVGRVVVECYGEAWAAFWGGMPGGKSVLEFLASMDPGYLHSKLSRPNQTRKVDAYLIRIVDAICIAVRQPAKD